MRIGKKEIAGGAIFTAGLVLFGKETLLWAYGKLLDAVSTGAPEMTLATFSWQNVIATFLTLFGAGLLVWPKPKIIKATRAERLYSLYIRGDDIVERVRRDRNLDWFKRNYAEDRIDLVRDGLSTKMFYENEGLAVPTFQTKQAESVCVGLESYFSALAPLMRDGHLEQIDDFARIAAQQAEKEAASFDPKKYVVEKL